MAQAQNNGFDAFKTAFAMMRLGTDPEIRAMLVELLAR